jgi:hypothetical protein
MKMRARNVAWLLPFFLTACFPFHKKQPPLDQLLAPVLANLSKPPVDRPELPVSALVLPDEPLLTDDDVEEEDVPAPRHKRLLPGPVQQQVASPPSAPDESSGVSAIGTLTSGEPVGMRRETEESLAATERGVNSIRRNLSDQERKTVAQIQQYIKQAREALNTGDVGGAFTLAAKAKTVLTELSQ